MDIAVTDIQASRVRDPADVEVMRNLRNLTASGFAYFNGQIEQDQQVEWWVAMQGKIKAWLYWNFIDGEPVGNGCMYMQRQGIWRQVIGYGMLREESARWWNSVAVHPERQGQGYGSYITHDLIVRHGATVHSVVRRDNPAARIMHRPGEWQEINGPEPERLIYLVTKVP